MGCILGEMLKSFLFTRTQLEKGPFMFFPLRQPRTVRGIVKGGKLNASGLSRCVAQHGTKVSRDRSVRVGDSVGVSDGASGEQGCI